MDAKTKPKPKSKKDSFKKWGVRLGALFFVAGAIALLLIFVPGLFSGDEKQQGETRVATAVVATPAITSRTIKAGVTCPLWTFEPQRCTFDEIPTAGFGQRVTGGRFCIDIPFGPDQPYRFQRWDTGLSRFVDITMRDGPDVRVSQTRFVGNRPGEAVTVTYWLAGPEGCETTPLLSPEAGVVKTVTTTVVH